MNTSLRPAVIAGNWKMNNTPSQAQALITQMLPLVKDASCQVVIGVPFVNLPLACQMCKGTNVKVAAQNCHWEEKGAFTGEISPQMLTELGVEYVILGHSERRTYFGETDESLNKRVLAALNAGLKVILCVGESLQQREANVTNEFVCMQVKLDLQNVSEEMLKNVIIAYEPIWAIGTGKTATAQQAQEVCKTIRACIASLYGKQAADGMTIQYGGSMNAGNAAELLSQEDIDGGLIGGASLKAPDFATIVAAAK